MFLEDVETQLWFSDELKVNSDTPRNTSFLNWPVALDAIVLAQKSVDRTADKSNRSQ
jgi:hypothetical protein